MSQLAEQEIKYLKGVGPKRAELLEKELGIHTCRDLLFFFPYKYIDDRGFISLKKSIQHQAFIQLKGKITHFRIEGQRNKQRLVGVFTDGTGIIELVWFQGIQWVTRNYQPNIEYIVFGRPAVYNHRLSIAHPEIETAGNEEARLFTPLQPQYSTTEKLKNSFITSKTIHRMMGQVLAQIEYLDETLPDYLIRNLKLTGLDEAIRNMHYPESSDKLQKSTYRLKFEELFYLQLNILLQKNKRTVFH